MHACPLFTSLSQGLVLCIAALLLQVWQRNNTQAVAQCNVMAAIAGYILPAAFARICHLEKELAAVVKYAAALANALDIVSSNYTQLQSKNSKNEAIMAQNATALGIAHDNLREADANNATLTREKEVSCCCWQCPANSTVACALRQSLRQQDRLAVCLNS
jgi:hypothetical protein